MGAPAPGLELDVGGLNGVLGLLKIDPPPPILLPSISISLKAMIKMKDQM
jgi:hypothetical protein